MPPIAAGSIGYLFIMKRGLLPTSKCFGIAKKNCLSAKKVNFCELTSPFPNAWLREPILGDPVWAK